MGQAVPAAGYDDMPLFSLDGVTMEVPGRTLLQPLTASFATGKTIGLIGHNGSGKSTLLKILARIQEPTAGRVSFEGKALAAWGNREFARKLAYLPQYTPAASGMLAKELVALGRYPWHGALGQFTKADQEKVDEAIELTDTVAFRDRLVDTLPTGASAESYYGGYAFWWRASARMACHAGGPECRKPASR